MASPKSPSAGPQTKRVCLGKVASAHGVKGLVKLVPYGEDITLIESLSPVYTGEKSSETLSVKIQNTAGKHVLASIDGCTNRDQVEKLRGTELWVERNALPAIENDDEFYVEDLIGLEVRDDQKKTVGRIVKVDNFGGGDLLDVKPDHGQSAYIPFRDPYVGDINTQEGWLALTRDGLDLLLTP